MSMLDSRIPVASAAIHLLHRATRANQALETPLSPGEQAAMVSAAARKIEELLEVFQIDHQNDPHTRDTPRRVARMFVTELMRGRFAEPPELTRFAEVAEGRQLIISGPIALRSTCAHHLLPVYGHAFVGVQPGADGGVVGLSKYDRVVAHFAARLQVQEELVQQIGRFLMAETAPRGLAVRITAVHMCKTHRGVLGGHDARMVTSAYFGTLADDVAAQHEFTRECRALMPSPR